MIWKATAAQRPNSGDTRTVVRFAWLPKRIGNIRILWLQYEALQVWVTDKVRAFVEGQEVEFITGGRWVTVTERQIKWQQVS